MNWEKRGWTAFTNYPHMSGGLIKERNMLENEFATPESFIDRWSATA